MTGLVALILLLTGVAAALLGDWVGRQAGKRRWSLFRLRPKHTGVLLTVLGGAFLAAVTALPLSVALLDWQQVDVQVQVAKDSLEHAQRRIQQLEQRKTITPPNRPVQVAAAPSAANARFRPQSIQTATPPAPQAPKWLIKQGDVLMEAAIRGHQSPATARLAMQELLAMVERHGQKLGSGQLQVTPQELQRAVDALTTPGSYTIQVATNRNVASRDRLGVQLQVIPKAPAWGELMEKERLSRHQVDSQETLNHLTQASQRASASPPDDDMTKVLTQLPEEPKQVRVHVHDAPTGPIRATVEVE